MRCLDIYGPGVVEDEAFCPNCHVLLDEQEGEKICHLCHYQMRQGGRNRRRVQRRR